MKKNCQSQIKSNRLSKIHFLKNDLTNKDKELQREIDVYMFLVGWISIFIFASYEILSKLTGFRITKFEIPCIFHRVTGYDCPGCGGTRAVIFLLHGDVIKSFQYHPIVLYTVVIGGIFLLTQTVSRLTGGRIKPVHMKIFYFWIALGIIILNCIIKNAALFYGINLLP